MDKYEIIACLDKVMDYIDAKDFTGAIEEITKLYDSIECGADENDQ